MSAGSDNDHLKVLVVDDQPFQRRLIAETLRTIPRIRIEQADSLNQCFDALAYFQPDLLITDWDMEGGDGLTLVKRLRAGEAGPTLRALPVIMAAERSREKDIARARNCGIDEFVLKPFTTQALIKHVNAVRARQREFVESVAYVGPCRRRARNNAGEAPRRRLFDAATEGADAPEIQIKKGLARMYAERIQILVAKAKDANAMRNVSIACAQLNALAGDMSDSMLMSACSSLFSYAKGIGADGALNHEVIKAHLDAIVQLAELPNSQYEVRAAVARELGVLVTKKLRAAAA